MRGGYFSRARAPTLGTPHAAAAFRSPICSGRTPSRSRWRRGTNEPPSMSRPGSGSDARAASAAALAATVIIALQLAGKATRDALFLSTFGVAALPAIVIASAVISGVLAVLLARVMARTQPGLLVPRLYALSAALLLAEWALVNTARAATAILVYLHITALGA